VRATLAAVFIALFSTLTSSVAIAKDDFLPPEQAYKYSTRANGDQVIVTWKIEPGYYLYKKKMSIVSPLSSVQLGDPQWPKGEDHEDEYFGRQEIYRGTIEVPVAIIEHASRPSKLPLELKLQGCADAGLCYPPLTWKTEVALPAATVERSSSSTNARSLFPSTRASNQDEFLPPDEAFRFGASMLRPDAVALTWIIAEDYYLYKDRIQVSSSTSNVLGDRAASSGGNTRRR
jgi:thiol:disulfide interchange protein DsbD